MIEIENITMHDVRYLIEIKKFSSVIDNLMFIKFNTIGIFDYTEYLLPDISNFLTALCKKIELKNYTRNKCVSNIIYPSNKFNLFDIIRYTIMNSEIDILYEFYLYSKVNYFTQITEITTIIGTAYHLYKYNDNNINYAGFESYRLIGFFNDISADKIRQYKLDYISSL